MREIADLILEGDLCQYCGEYLGTGDGYPRSCMACEDNDEYVHPFSREGLGQD